MPRRTQTHRDRDRGRSVCSGYIRDSGLSVCAIWAPTERIKTLFDRSPPFTNAQQNNFAARYNALVADLLLRNFYVNLKYTFF